MSLYFCLKLNKKVSLDQESLLRPLCYSLRHYWDRIFTSEILLSEAGKSIIFGLVFSNEWVPNNSSDHLLNFAHTCYYFPISYWFWISEDAVHVASHFFKTYNFFDIIVINKLSLVFFYFCQELTVLLVILGLHNGSIWRATCCWNSKE